MHMSIGLLYASAASYDFNTAKTVHIDFSRFGMKNEWAPRIALIALPSVKH